MTPKLKEKIEKEFDKKFERNMMIEISYSEANKKLKDFLFSTIDKVIKEKIEEIRKRITKEMKASLNNEKYDIKHNSNEREIAFWRGSCFMARYILNDTNILKK
jgi:NCAIR mutase (PurE)-related protein